MSDGALKTYDIDACLPCSALASHLESLAKNDRSNLQIYVLNPPPDAIQPDISPDQEHLRPAIDECRVTKDAYELALLRHANTISTAAHTAVLRAIPHATNEQDLEATFIATCISAGAKHQAYHGIFGSGENAATLHYQHNDQPLAGRRNVLVDAGAEWSCYCSDVTRTFPLLLRDGGGRFDPESRAIYALVLRMQDAVFRLLKAGVAWEDLHIRAHEVAVEGLLELGILRGGTAEELMESRISVAFFPHGLGHFLGMDTHDVGGSTRAGEQDGMLKYLRIRGVIPEGAVVTVEPGVYFCRFILEPVLKGERGRRFVDEGVLERYWGVGGVRIEGMSFFLLGSGWIVG